MHRNKACSGRALAPNTSLLAVYEKIAVRVHLLYSTTLCSDGVGVVQILIRCSTKDGNEGSLNCLKLKKHA